MLISADIIRNHLVLVVSLLDDSDISHEKLDSDPHIPHTALLLRCPGPLAWLLTSQLHLQGSLLNDLAQGSHSILKTSKKVVTGRLEGPMLAEQFVFGGFRFLGHAKERGRAKEI